ncbi:carbohydrate ABC transporter permease [Nonomuraea gerenzanensis]|uniref:N-Acetyl-D-glucosamine ABC transport system, permease protein 2 n=1 Tax=Nonomuraea gerenzanensis TaxID=93944 RepID=A0A1M4EHY1_9ACTN|nr:carbohydrate ABC transporter permease [Nonomuraea gerenzanensis]UBU10182.1 carbohydrate ABC transporter permease [Nonomuraea gerenzanensis]SBO98557.1 N-Acetyl-D-glucosamine ABC transport system, permease protein 2 [Nonomuraea gerenzanensis]
MTRTTRRQRAVIYLGLSIGLALVAGPFLWTALSSVKPEQEIRRDPPTFWPETWTPANFAELFGRVDLGTAFANSVIIALVLVATNLLFCSMVGYAFAKLSFRGKNVLFGLVLVQLAIPAIVVLMPQFVLIARLGLVNTFVGIILPTVVTPLGVFMMRQFISDLPDELIDAARVDGARELRVFFTIILPLCGPALATLGLITFLGSWNNFLWPAVVAQSEDLYTLPVALNILNGYEGTHYNLLVAGSVVVIAPILFLFVFLQRFFIQGIATTGLK